MPAKSARLGLDYYIKFMALISISLGVLNLLPIPVLDGGHLVYHVEVIRGKPLSLRVVALTQQIGMAILCIDGLCTFQRFHSPVWRFMMKKPCCLS